MTTTISSTLQPSTARRISGPSDLSYQDKGCLFRDGGDRLFVIIETKSSSAAAALVGGNHIDEDISPSWPLILEPSSTVVTIRNEG